MGRTVALSTLRSDVRFKADIGGATVRHTDAQLTRLINQSIQMFRERISDEGSTHYLVPYSGTLGIGPTSPYAFYQLDLSSGPSPALVRTYGIDVTIDGVVCKLEHVPFEARNDYGTIPGGSRPIAWCHFRTDQVGILPASSAAYPFTVWYLPKFTDLSADADTFDGVAGWEEWVVWDVVCQVIARDQFPQAYAIAEQRRAEVEQRVIRGATKVTQAGGAHVGRDSFGSKLPHFLGGSRRPQAVAGGPYVPAGGSVTDAMLVDMTGPTVKGVLSGTTRPYSIGIGTLTTYLSPFSTLQRGLVPPPLSIGSRYLDDSGNWSVPAGGGGGGSVGPSGAVQFQAGTGMAGASGFRVIGNSPSLLLRLDGSLRVTGGDVAVGSGTTRIQSTGIDAGGGSVVNVATFVAQDVSARSLLVSSGIPNSQLSPMASGTVKARLGADGLPTDVPVATLLSLVPTFTSTFPGVVPGSGGGSANFLRADGIWAAPPGGSASPGEPDQSVQFRSSDGTFYGASGIQIIGSGAASSQAGGGAALVFGRSSAADGLGTIRSDGEFSIFGTNASGINVRLLRMTPTGTAGLATAAAVQYGTVTSNRLYRQHWSVGTGGLFSWEAGATGSTAQLSATGMDLSRFHLAARSLNVSSGIPNTELSPMASGTVKGQLGADGIPQDIPLQSLTTALYLFDSTNRGVVPGSGGGSANFLRADGVWAAPASGSSPTGVTNAQLADMPTGTVKARLSGTGAAQDVPLATLLAFAPTFTSARAGVVPNSDGSATSFLAGDGVWRAPSGAHQFPPVAGATNAQLAVMPTGTVKGNLSGNATPSDVSIATLFAFAPTFTSTRPGTVPQSGGGTTNYLRADGSWAAPSGAAQYPPVGGVSNVEMAVMPTGTVKANLSGNATPSDVSIATLFAFSPTFTATQRGVVPASGGGTTNYLRADGAWDSPPGGAASPGGAIGNLQYNNGVGFAGASGVNIVASGRALAFGVPSFLPSSGDIRVASGGLSLVHGPGGETAQFLPTGLDLRPFHIRAKSIDVEHINGLPATANNLKRGANIPATSSGVPSGLFLYAPRGAASGANRYIVASGTMQASGMIFLRPSGAKGGEVIRIERVDTFAAPLAVCTPTGTVLHAMPSGTKSWADFMYTKPSGPNFELAGHADMH